MDPTAPAPRAREAPPAARRAIPAFALYGEPGAPAAPELLHIEEVQQRSRLYHWEIDAHRHPGLHQVLWLRAGSAEVALDEARLSCSGPAAVLIPPGVVHAFRFAPETDGHVLTLSARAVVEGDAAREAGEALRTLFEAPRVLALEPDAPGTLRLDALLSQLHAEFHAPDLPGSPVTLWLARAVLWRLARIEALQAGQAERGAEAQRHHALFTRFLELLEAHYLEHWPVARYAAQLGLSPERLNRLAQAQAGRNALALIHERLGREACRRLVYIAAPISRLAFELGFEDPAYFCRFFKRRTGLSPREYRLRHGGAGG